MRLLRSSQIIRVIMILVVLVLMGRFTSTVFTEDDLTEKDKIVANLENKSKRACESEVARIKEIRRNQIDALVQVIRDSQQDLAVNRPSMTVYPLISAVELLGDLRATEAVDPLISLSCFDIDRKLSERMTGNDRMAVHRAIKSSSLNALTKIGKPAVPLLINLLKVLKSETTDTSELISKVPKDQVKKTLSDAHKSKFFRKVLYLIEGDCAIHRLEAAYKAETDKEKKERLKGAIAKFRSEFKLKPK